MKKKNERRIAMLLAMMMLVMNLIISPVWAAPGVAIDETNFPDKNFRTFVSTKFDKDNDGKLSDTETAHITSIEVIYKNIADLKGIEYFTALKELRCDNNQLTSLDISKNTALEKLECYSNKLTSLDISKNTALEKLDCDNNQLTSLDISKNTALQTLGCEDNQLTSLDLSQNPSLKTLFCDNNQLISLDLSNNPSLESLYCQDNQLTSLDLSQNPSLKGLICNNNQLISLDISQNPSLESLWCNYNQLTSLDLSNNPSLKGLWCYNNQLTSLDVSKNSALQELDCDDNKLTNLDVSKNTALEGLECDNNQLTSLDVSKNPALKYLDCNNNQLTSLDLSKNPALQKLYCWKNQLTSLDVSNNPALEYLSCFSNQLTKLDVSKNSALEELECGFNKLTNLDVSNNPALKNLDCGINQLTSLDVSNSPALKYLECQNNKLTKLDVSKNSALKELHCYSNHLTSLNLVNNTEINDFFGKNQTYDVKVKTSDMKIPYADFPDTFDITKATNIARADSNFIVDASKPSTVTYDYATGLTGEEISVTLNITYVYTVTFNTNGGSSVNPQTITAGDLVTKPADPTKDSFTFDGWYKDAEFTTPFDFATETINADTTIYAKWTQNAPARYTVTFNTNGGSAVNPQTITAGGHVTIPTAPTKDGYTFAGWYKDAGLTTPFDFANEKINADITLYAKWTQNAPTSYTVTFNTNGGTAINPQTITAGKHVTKPADPTKDGYTFAGWYKDAGLTTPFDFANEKINADITLYAKWTQNAPPTPAVDSIAVNSTDHKTAYKVGEPLDVTNLTILVTMSDSTTKTENVTADMVSGFDSNTEGSQTLTITYEGKTTSYNVTVTAAPTPPPTPVTYTLTASVDGGHGSVTPTNATKNKDETVTLTFAPDTGYELDTVTVNGTLAGVIGNVLDVKMNENKTVVVKYKAVGTSPIGTPVTITFDKNGGSGTMADVTKNKGEQYPLPACGFIPPAGKEFKAWQVDGTEKNVGDNIVLNGNKTIKAVWKDIGSVPPTPPVPPTPYIPYPWIVYPGWYYNIEAPKPKEEKPVTKMEIDWKLELMVGVSTINREINGVQSKIKMDIAPYIRDGRIMLPIRYVAEALGFDVEWIRSTRTVVLKNNSTRVEIPVDTNKIIVNGTVYTSDVKPEIKNNRTMLPIANIARALGLKDGKDIIWNSKSKMVTIYRSIVVK